MTRRLRIDWGGATKVTGILAGPGEGALGLLLAPGAGAGQRSEFITHLRRRLGERGLPVLTFDYPYQEAGRRSPDKRQTLLACHLAAAERLADRCEQVVLTGKSMGGRIGSHVVADLGFDAAGLVYYGYPLLPPGRTEPRSTEHLERIEVPQLFWCGDRDRLSPPPLVAEIASTLRVAEVSIVADADHSFRVPKTSGLGRHDVLDHLVDGTAGFLRRL